MYSSETEGTNGKRRVPGRSELAMLFILILFSAFLCIILYQRFFSEKMLCLEINGKKIGFISDIHAYEEAYDEIYENILKKSDSEYVFSSEISFSQKNVLPGVSVEYMDVDDFSDALVDAESELEYAYAVYLNGHCIALCDDGDAGRSAVVSAVDKIASELLKSEPSFISVDGNNEVDVKLTIATKDSVWSSDDIFDLLCSKDELSENHIAVDNVLDVYEEYIHNRERETAEAEIAAKKEFYIKSAAESCEIDCDGDEFDEWLEEYKCTDGYISAMAAFDAELAELTGAGEGAVTTEDISQTETGNETEYGYCRNPAAASLIDFNIVFNETVYETIPKDVVTTEIDTRKTDYTAVTKEGKNGVVYAEYSVSFSGGEFKRTEIRKNVVIEPVTEFRNVGVSEYTEPGVVTGTFFWPIETDNMLVSSFFEDYREEFDGDSYHFGMDILGYKDDPVWASDGGTVEFCGWRGSYGNLLIINHGNGKKTYYAHLRENEMSVGDEVYQGQVVGHVGLTGSTTNYHLHFEIRVDNVPCNPVDFLPETELRQW